MSNRYEFDEIVYSPVRGRVYASIYYPTIPESTNDIFIIAKDSDRMDLLAFKYYGDVTNWWIIAHANQINGTLFLPPGKQIRIPMDLASIVSETKKINNIS